MFVDVTPAGGTGPHVVLLHGLGASHYSWHHTVDDLKADFTTHAVDLIGFGDSAAPRTFGYTMPQQADAVIKYLTDNKIMEFSLIGHSMGGGIASFIVDELRTRPEFTINKLVLVAAVSYNKGLFDFASLVPNIPGSPLQHLGLPSYLTPGLAEFFLNRVYSDKHTPDQEQIKTYGRIFARPGWLNSFLSHSRTLHEIEDVQDDYPNFGIETLVVWGKDDTILNKKFAGRLETDLMAQTVLIDDCGHIPQEECPAETNAAIRNVSDELKQAHTGVNRRSAAPRRHDPRQHPF